MTLPLDVPAPTKPARRRMGRPPKGKAPMRALVGVPITDEDRERWHHGADLLGFDSTAEMVRFAVERMLAAQPELQTAS